MTLHYGLLSILQTVLSIDRSLYKQHYLTGSFIVCISYVTSMSSAAHVLNRNVNGNVNVTTIVLTLLRHFSVCQTDHMVPPSDDLSISLYVRQTIWCPPVMISLFLYMSDRPYGAPQ